MQRPRRYLAPLLVALLAGVGTITHGQSPEPGTLDPTFGTGGVSTISLASLQIKKVATQMVENLEGLPEEMIVGVGAFPWTIARFRADGALDTTFGMGGVVTKTFRKGSGSLNGVVVQPDNKVVVAGTVPVTSGRSTVNSLAVARYNENGTDDTSFGSGGLAAILISPYGVTLTFGDVALQSDGSIIVVGRANTSDGYCKLFAARLLPDGHLDSTFADGGVFTYQHRSKLLTQAYAVAIQTVAGEERIVIAAPAQESASPYLSVALMIRLTPSGKWDTTFGDYYDSVNGVWMTRTAVAGAEETDFTDITIDSADNSIVAAGAAYFPGIISKSLAARYGTDGWLDTSFGTGGTTILPSDASGLLYAVAIQPDGKILTSTSHRISRLLPSGSLDSSFGPDKNGQVTRSAVQFCDLKLVAGTTNAFIVGGRAIVTKGKGGSSTTSLWALWRYFY